LEAAWRRVSEQVMPKKALLGSVLQNARPIAVHDETLVIGLAGNHFHKELLADRANKELVQQAVQQHVAGARRFEVSTGESAASGTLDHPAVRAALAAFPGEVISVRPRIPEGQDQGGPQ